MSIKDILVHVDPAPVNDDRLHLAADLARRYGAHMIGVGLGDTTAEGIFRTWLQGESLAGEWRPTTGTEESLASFVTCHARAAVHGPSPFCIQDFECIGRSKTLRLGMQPQTNKFVRTVDGE